ncbi:hypothetical protein FOA52_013188 [Chlamydomonas sp. UWO 241]|nr:hypothetical protein FOA52_013188 [Chlamydomonas sp. UWO 241]
MYVCSVFDLARRKSPEHYTRVAAYLWWGLVGQAWTYTGHSAPRSCAGRSEPLLPLRLWHIGRQPRRRLGVARTSAPVVSLSYLAPASAPCLPISSPHGVQRPMEMIHRPIPAPLPTFIIAPSSSRALGDDPPPPPIPGPPAFVRHPIEELI